ncbi:hypothetical protein DdX_20469 [Ditylenchus destructor]|uniref:Uncharacterized protein n=1 Tax=Ditylenchus destructor TaxID=166010 RepID=A0AAD4QWD1_9BILA|nr:hypothetical protein DdX_20469 [Ditylenchus destructor]
MGSGCATVKDRRFRPAGPARDRRTSRKVGWPGCAAKGTNPVFIEAGHALVGNPRFGAQCGRCAHQQKLVTMEKFVEVHDAPPAVVSGSTLGLSGPLKPTMNLPAMA